jgi:hypothetical protein
MKANQKFRGDTKAASFLPALIMLLIGILVAAVLVGTVSQQSYSASVNTSVTKVPGGPALIMLWPLMFIIAPLLFMVKTIFF